MTFRSSLLTLTAILAAGSMFSGAAQAAEGFTDAQKKEIGAIVDSYIMENPDIVMRAYAKHQEVQQAAADEAAKSVVAELQKAVKTDKSIPVVGDRNAKFLIVEFLDYNCGFCKRGFETVEHVIKNNKDIAVAFIEFPILSPQSRTAALYALAAHDQGKYWEFHQELMKFQGAKEEATLKELAGKVGIDVKKLEAKAKDPATEKLLESHMGFAQKANLSGTPAFFIGNQINRGYVTVEQMDEIIAQERKAAK